VPKQKIISLVRTGLLDEEAIAALKAKHGEVKAIIVRISDEEESIAYYKLPSRVTIGLAYNALVNKEFNVAGEVVVNHCFLAGDERQISDDKIGLAASVVASGFIEILEGKSEGV
jgi:hypothetical protein